MIDIINSRNNLNKCGECGSDYPTWASVNLGILLCGRCANCHRKVLSRDGPDGRPISIVKSLTLEAWSESQLENLKKIGNRRAKQRWNPKKVPFPHDDDVDFLIEDYLKDKYIEGKFRDDRIEASEYGGSDYLSQSDYENSLSRQSLAGKRNRPVPRLSHRKLTSYEQTQYRHQGQKIRGLGYSDMDAILESLHLAKGDINFALDILDNDSKVNPSLEEVPPSLPKRPSRSAGSGTASNVTTPANTTPATSAGTDWWNQPQSVQQTGQYAAPTGQFQAAAPAAQPQIYQYTDPVTGHVSYVDSSGQQYLDPSNPQHQQLLMQQTNPQYLQQHASKQNILSLYNQAQNPAQPQAQAQAQAQAQTQTQAQPQLGQYGMGQAQQQTGLAQYPMGTFGQPQGLQQQQPTQMYSQMMGQAPLSQGFAAQATGYGQYNQTYQPFR